MRARAAPSPHARHRHFLLRQLFSARLRRFRLALPPPALLLRRGLLFRGCRIRSALPSGVVQGQRLLRAQVLRTPAHGSTLRTLPSMPRDREWSAVVIGAFARRRTRSNARRRNDRPRTTRGQWLGASIRFSALMTLARKPSPPLATNSCN